MSYNTTVWTEVARAVKDGQSLSDEWSSDVIVKHLYQLPQDVASVLYTDLCKIQLASSGEIKEPLLNLLDGVIDASEPSQIQRFCSLVIDNGRVVEMVADCVELPPYDRKKKWESKEREWRREAMQQRQNGDVTRRFSEFSVRSRHENEIAYISVRNRLSVIQSTKVPWELVIIQTPERVGRFTQQFWREFQTARCTIEEKQALCHKLELVHIQSTCPAHVIAHKTRLMQHLFESGATGMQRHRRRVSCWKHFLKRF